MLKVTVKGVTASFRHPDFRIGTLLTYEMPPPATIYGFLSAISGELVQTDGLLFAYQFTYGSKNQDYEHYQNLFAVETNTKFNYKGQRYQKVMEQKVVPLNREFLAFPELVLYVNKPEWAERFLSPTYAITLGRSQDLCEIVSVDVVDVVENGKGVFSNTLMPQGATFSGYPVAMPRYITEDRDVTLDLFEVLDSQFGTDELLEQTFPYFVDNESAFALHHFA